MGPPVTNVHYAMYDASYDPVPLLSSYENPKLGAGNLKQIVSNLTQGQLPSSDELLQPATSNAYNSLVSADQLPWDKKLSTYIDPGNKYQGQIFNINDVGTASQGTGLPRWESAPMQLPFPSLQNDPQATTLNIGHTLNLDNHMNYFTSNQLNAASTSSALPNINPQTLGPSEYFGLHA